MRTRALPHIKSKYLNSTHNNYFLIIRTHAYDLRVNALNPAQPTTDRSTLLRTHYKTRSSRSYTLSMPLHPRSLSQCCCPALARHRQRRTLSSLHAHAHVVIAAPSPYRHTPLLLQLEHKHGARASVHVQVSGPIVPRVGRSGEDGAGRLPPEPAELRRVRVQRDHPAAGAREGASARGSM